MHSLKELLKDLDLKTYQRRYKIESELFASLVGIARI
jgi:hypothetical protein